SRATALARVREAGRLDAVNAEHAALWQRIAGFVFDEPAASLPFSARLAQDQGWSREYALRVIEEYRRFAFLAVAAGHPVSPSDAVDQAWHEHLTYTRSYWDGFCGHVVGRPLHHAPTQGGAAEAAKFAGWYAQTLASYQAFFEQAPPADIWPAAAQRARQTERFARINLARNWIVPKPTVHATSRWMPLAATLVLLTGCGGFVAATTWPFDLSGPDFLWIYGVLVVVALGLSFLIRARLLADQRPDDGQFEGGVIPVALLAGGSARVLGITVANLYTRGYVAVGDGNRLHALQSLPSGASELELLVHHHASHRDGARWNQVIRAGSTLLAPEVDRLRERGLVISQRQTTRARWWAVAPMVAVFVIGMVKLIVGLQRNRPVELLGVGLLVVAILIGIIRRWRPWRTPAGEALLTQLRTEHDGLAKQGAALAPAHPQLALGLALFGGAVLPDPLRELQACFNPSSGGQVATNGDGGGCGGSCGGGCGGCSGGD
ncbi:MAG TPA: TIGR04222 domain-containing membrane protein, partial [Opitutaceae bacterium]|nr:TIGR04222 domain-containing membrane protein [Opitutaceae bacterium]